MTAIAPPREPVVVQVARGLLGFVAVGHVVVPLVMWAREAVLRNEIAVAHPEFGVGEVARSADVAVGAAVGFHVVLLVLCLVPVWKLGGGKPWVRRLVTVSKLLGLVFSMVSWSASGMFHAVIPVVGVLQVASVVLLWVPAGRKFFAGCR
ncbi:hypothetical protein QRX50_18055 [Amycolatopsis carbonis]|uniref:Uncharacterized protein n=1 Tax=Amycolatopsis carbonis TaxID=715471 RepID=A0A9Y2IMG9_9PSEU|nr:hypothetical protein [Amycolatopsis sp. 2-15]WIX82532.1 hypothetical protein QRX50_18055 [Amycolatopsis sp. 2-15]